MSLLIRIAGVEDVPAIVVIYASHVLTSAATFEMEPPDADEVDRRMHTVIEGGFPYLVAEVDGMVAGYAYASPFRAREAYRFMVEDSVYVRAEYAGRGVGRELLKELMERCRVMGCHQMIAVIGGVNPASVAMHAAMGFAHVGVLREVGFKFDAWQDVTLMQRGL
jgi:L-amino acid N-acyltransferase YncA